MKAEEIHGNLYDYTNSIFINTSSPITIKCKKHNKNFTLKRAGQHISKRKQGCKLCGSNKIKFSEFVRRANITHNNKFTYIEKSYNGMEKYVDVVCPDHGSFTVNAHHHTKGISQNCPLCTKEKQKEKALQKFIVKANQKHKNIYKYFENTYIYKSKATIEAECNRGHRFTLRCESHISEGYGCQQCAVTGFKSNRPGILYYLSINNGQAYKIGITNRTVKERFSSDMQYITILHQIHYKLGSDAYVEEQRILKLYKEYRYKGLNLLKDGNTELFSIDIFKI